MTEKDDHVTSPSRIPEVSVLESLRGGLVVSCQAPSGPLRDSAVIAAVAAACVAGGAVAIRAGGVGGIGDIEAVVGAIDVPVIGLTKEGEGAVYITPSVASVEASARAGAQVVAIDGTKGARSDGSSLAEQVAAAHGAGALAMADVSTTDEALGAVAAGFDLVSTTLSGYTAASTNRSGPDLALVADIRRRLPRVFLVAEGRYHDPKQVSRAFELGADAVVVGTAITDLSFATARFVTR